MSSGEYFIMMNSDDYYSGPDAISTLVSCMKENDADVAFGAYENVQADGSRCIVQPNPDDFFYKMSVNELATMKKMKLLHDHGLYDESFKLASDYDFFYKIMMEGAKWSVTKNV